MDSSSILEVFGIKYSHLNFVKSKEIWGSASFYVFKTWVEIWHSVSSGFIDKYIWVPVKHVQGEKDWSKHRTMHIPITNHRIWGGKISNMNKLGRHSAARWFKSSRVCMFTQCVFFLGSSQRPTTHIWGIGESASLNLGVNQNVNGCPWQPVQSVPHLLLKESWESDPVKGESTSRSMDG